MEYWSDGFKTQYSNTPVFQHSIPLDLDARAPVVVDLPIDSKHVNHAFKGGKVYGWQRQ